MVGSGASSWVHAWLIRWLWGRGVAVFDDENLVSCAGLVPVMELVEQTGLSDLLDEHVVFRSERIRSERRTQHATISPKVSFRSASIWSSANRLSQVKGLVISTPSDEIVSPRIQVKQRPGVPGCPTSQS